jgi:peptidoglycan lytic transglycosylase
MVILCIRLLYMMLAWSIATAAPVELPSAANGAVQTPLASQNPAVSQNLEASWYGPRYNGRLTASGEVFDMTQLTAAHRELPFGTRLQVTCLENGRSVLVRINDRGPFVAGRDLDLSLAAARKLGIERRGLALVQCERLAD